jgi:hypothetical protein
MIAKMMLLLAQLIFQMNFRVLLYNWAFSDFMSFLTVYKAKTISRDPGNSREITF